MLYSLCGGRVTKCDARYFVTRFEVLWYAIIGGTCVTFGVRFARVKRQVFRIDLKYYVLSNSSQKCSGSVRLCTEHIYINYINYSSIYI